MRTILPLLVIVAAAAAEPQNLALNRPVSASGEQDSGGNFAAAANDGDPNTRWCCNNGDLNNWWQVDLGPGRAVRRFEIDWEHDFTPYRYRIEVSADGQAWRTAVDATAAPGVIAAAARHDVDEQGVRYARITVTGQQPGVWTGFWEFRALDARPAATTGWQQMPLTDARQREQGIAPGGEGCQRIKSLACDRRDGRLQLIGTDVGGMYRSTDGGRRWEPCNTGIPARGVEAFAIDPQDPARVLAVGTNGVCFGDYHGLYLSTDAGATWMQVLKRNMKDYAHDTVVFVPKGPVALWASPEGLWRSEDRGLTWNEVAGTAALARAQLRAAPDGAIVWAGGAKGLSVSRDGGRTWSAQLPDAVTGLDAVGNGLWVCTADRILHSADGGASFTPLAAKVELGDAKGIRFRRIAISPADPRRIIVGDGLHGFRYWSEDAGATFRRAPRDVSPSFLPARLASELSDDGHFAWHPTDPARAWSIGVGDMILGSRDGGRSWRWDNNGYAGLMTGSTITMNAREPDLLYVGSQDYNGALTRDAGRSWEFVNLSRFRFGYVYGGYMAGHDLLFGGVGGHWGGKRTLFVLRGANDVANVVDTGIVLEGHPVCAGDPADGDVLFAYGHRSADRGRTWTRMAGCDGVLAHDVQSKVLYGLAGKRAVRSSDHGATWTAVGELAANISDLAVDHRRQILLIAAGDRLWRLPAAGGAPEEISARAPADQFGQRRITTVAIDPVDPDVQYVGQRKDIYIHDASVARSLDGGQTFTCVVRCPRLGVMDSALDGGREPQCIRVHPANRSLYVGTNCFGLWRLPPPAR